MTLPPLGLDIAKLKFNACLVRAGGKLRHRAFSNDEAGFAQLSAWLTKNGAALTHACMEATLVAGFCAERRPPAWRPPAPELRELQALVRRLEALVEMRVAEGNRLSSGGTVAAVRESVEEHIAYLAEQIKRTEKLIRDHIDRHPGLRRQRELLDSIPGIGETTAAALLAQVPDILQYKSARQVAAFAGLVPRERQSGGSIRGRVRLSKIGNARLRKALYFPAVTALRCSPFFQSWAEGLRQRGKSKMAVIGAAMRKLVHLAYGVLKTGEPVDPEWTQKTKTA